MKKPELLSPAGDFDSLKSAVFAGADAVYFGGKSFNARVKAQNFDLNMKDAVAFAHLYNVKTYLTLNTLIENDEIEELIDTVKYALECGIDAFIVQDFGVVYILKNVFEDIEIHASTQMAINSLQGALIAEKMGIKRVVLSRETSLQDIKLIKDNTNLEIEYFIQGALCVGFSGNCYFSSCEFGKSGNKGECMQPCRLPYKAILKEKVIGQGYLLSAKDICMANKLKELLNAGVDSFKIEGRLRRSAYVSIATKVYREIIDNNYKVTNQNVQNLKKAFNRGDFTAGYFDGFDKIIDKDVQNHKGVYIGDVIGFNVGSKFNTISIKSNVNINKNDVIKFLYNNKESITITAVDIKKESNIYKITTTNKVQIGSKAHLICDYNLEKDSLNYVKRLPIDFKLYAFADKPIKLEYVFNEIKGEVTGSTCQKALNIPLSVESAKQSLQKLNDTYFYLNNLELYTDGVFVSKQELNNLRKIAVENIKNSFYKSKNIKINHNKLKCIKNFEKIKKSLEIGEKYTSGCDFFVIRPKNYNAFEFDKIKHENCYLYVPAFLSNQDFNIISNILDKYEDLGVYAENIAGLNFNRKTILGAKLNIKNIFAFKQLFNKNVVGVVLSPELLDERFNELNGQIQVPCFKSNFVNFDLITFIHCPIKTLYNNECKDCKYAENIIYKMDNGSEFVLNRYILSRCYFILTKKSLQNSQNIVY